MRVARVASWVVVSVLVLATGAPALAETLVDFDLRKPDAAGAWKAQHDIRALTPTPDGLAIDIGGSDPYLVGPAADFPEGVPLRMTVRLKAPEPGMCQVFYYRHGPAERDSVRFDVTGGDWVEIVQHLPPLGKGYRLRVDPPGGQGRVVLQSIRFERREIVVVPPWPKSVAPRIGADAAAVRSGELEVAHDGATHDGFEVRVAGKPMARGMTRGLVGYVATTRAAFAPIDERAKVSVAREGTSFTARTSFADADGGQWVVARRFGPGKAPGAIDVETTITVDRDRDVLLLPALVVLPGAGTFGERKTQGLFAGLEYLDDEPSSSEADVIGPGARRQVPDALKVTFPLMAIAADERCVGLAWETSPQVAPFFDSPDRMLATGDGHAMGLLMPGSNGSDREEGSLVPHRPMRMKANEPIIVRATLLGATGKDATAAVRQYVALRGLPPLPDAGGFEAYRAQATAGWLDSGIAEKGRYRHALPGDWKAGPAADAAVWQAWLARLSPDTATAQRLDAAAKAAIAEVAPPSYNGSGVGHVRYPVAPLLFGHVEENAVHATNAARALVQRFAPDGSLPYKRSPNRPDYGRTHFAPDANGLTATNVANLLQLATVSGDPAVIKDALRLLRAMDRFRGSVPRGAQTWECPLHTPDILASAYLVRAYTLGYELTGDPALLDHARHWAWTGVPFIYLASPVAGRPVGPYATIAVLGATSWEAPNWMGLPVQWCGMVYADALYRLLPHDQSGPWKQLADGVTLSGIQQSWPAGKGAERQGLLPDSYALRSEDRRDPCINPATVAAGTPGLFGKTPVYAFRSLRTSGLLVHAAGDITDLRDEAGIASFTITPWPAVPSYVLVAGVKGAPRITIDGAETVLSAPHQYTPATGRVVLQVKGRCRVEVRTGG